MGRRVEQRNFKGVYDLKVKLLLCKTASGQVQVEIRALMITPGPCGAGYITFLNTSPEALAISNMEQLLLQNMKTHFHQQ